MPFNLPIRPDLQRVQRRTFTQKVAVGTPILSITAVYALGVVLRRALGRPHPLGWTLHEELLITLMRTLLTRGDIGVWRAFFRNVSSRKRVPPQVEVTPVARPGSRSLWFELRAPLRPIAPRASLTLLFAHGGAFVAGSARQYQLTYSVWLRQLAARGIDCRILSAHYPLAPEHKFPAGRDFVADEMQWLLDPAASGVTGPVAVGGDSAGANLVFSALAWLRDNGRLPSPPAACLLVSPAVDMSASCVFSRTDPEAAAAGAHDYLPRGKIGGALPHLYAERLEDPYVSVALLDDFGGLASDLLVTAGGAELMASDIRAFAKRLRAAAPGRGAVTGAGGGGWSASYLEEPGRVHSWPMLMLPHLLDKAAPIFDFLERAAGPV